MSEQAIGSVMFVIFSLIVFVGIAIAWLQHQIQ
jgi:hypothetical protein